MPTTSGGAVKVKCDWDDPVASGMAADPSIVKPSVLRARELAIVASTAKSYTAAELSAIVQAETSKSVKVALADFVAQLKAAGVQVVGATAPPAGGA
jgi:hypothetical protein